MQGRLKKPVNGTLAGLFGQDRGDGEVWKGVFYNTVPAPVSSIASGTVTFAGELEGYGKVVVLDHGDGYVSIYSGLSEIDIAQNYAVNAGSKIGTSGTLPSGETGLYLEVRYNGQVMNPLSWITDVSDGLSELSPSGRLNFIINYNKTRFHACQHIKQQTLP